MTERTAAVGRSVKVPSAEHPISIARIGSRVVVRAGGRVIADTRQALSLREAKYPEVIYIPRGDVEMSLVERTDHATYCPFKGDCAYYSIPSGGEKAVNAIWTYEAPFSAVAEIKGHFAFYADRVDSIETLP